VKHGPPKEDTQGRDPSSSLAARREALPQYRLTPQKYPSPSRRFKGHTRIRASLITHGSPALRCCYCRRRITPADDGQRVSKHVYSHTACAWRANDNFFAVLDKNANTPQLDTERRS
jgi:hypothetical protein